MTPDQIAIAQACHDGAIKGSLSFPQILGLLADAGFEGYLVDYRAGNIRYYLSSGASTDIGGMPWAVALPFDAEVITGAIKAAQANGPDYSYAGFTRTVTAGGCAGYLVSLSGRRVIYFGRTAEVHVEHFPGQA